MAHMVTPDDIKKSQEKLMTDDLSVVCYINSTAQTKAYSDVCVTSSNAERIVKALEQKNIFFIPDGNLGRNLAAKILLRRVSSFIQAIAVCIKTLWLPCSQYAIKEYRTW